LCVSVDVEWLLNYSVVFNRWSCLNTKKKRRKKRRIWLSNI